MSRVSQISLTLALAAGAWLLPITARAQGNYHSSPTGGRSALMGNTGVALGRDGAAPFLNPATIVRIHDASLAFSANFYSVTATRLSSYHQPASADANFPGVVLNDSSTTEARFEVIPSTLCFFFTVAGFGDKDDQSPNGSDGAEAPRRGRQKLGLCLGNVERQDLSKPALNLHATTAGGLTQQAGSLTRKWARWNTGPTYSAYLTNDLAVGISLHGVYTYYGFHDDNNTVTVRGAGGTISSNLGGSGAGYAVDIAAILGVTYKIGHYTAGMSAGLPSVHLAGGYEANLHQQYAGAPGENAVNTTGSGNFRAPPPVRLSAGLGREIGKLKLEVDGSYYFGMSEAIRSAMRIDQINVTGTAGVPASFDATYAVRARPTVIVAVGGEYFVTPSFSVLGGASTDFSASAPLDTAMTLGNFEKQRTSRVLLSGGIGSYGDAGDILIGTQLSYGWGQALAVNPYVLPNDYAIISTQEYGAMLILAGSTNLKAIRRAVERVEDIVIKKKPGEN